MLASPKCRNRQATAWFGCPRQYRTAVLLPITLLAVLLVTPCLAWAQPALCPQFFPNGNSSALLNPKLGQRVTLLCNDGYAAAASGVTHGTLWSAEHLTAADVTSARDTRRAGSFYADARIPFADQAQISDYRASGYDRGHMTPSGDMPTAIAQAQSFSLANAVPQMAELNRGIWERVESGVRDLALRQGEIYLVTGPAFQGSRVQSIGPDGVLVPTSMWKAVYDPRAGGAAVYVCPNTVAPQCAVVSVAVLAQTVGIDPFPGLPASVKAVAMDLPQPGNRSYASGRRPPPERRNPSLLERLFGFAETR